MMPKSLGSSKRFGRSVTCSLIRTHEGALSNLSNDSALVRTQPGAVGGGGHGDSRGKVRPGLTGLRPRLAPHCCGKRSDYIGTAGKACFRVEFGPGKSFCQLWRKVY